MIRARYSIVCDYCNTVFCDETARQDFENDELPSKFQEAKNRGWGISPGGDYLVYVLCNKCKEKGITCLDLLDKISNSEEEG